MRNLSSYALLVTHYPNRVSIFFGNLKHASLITLYCIFWILELCHKTTHFYKMKSLLQHRFLESLIFLPISPSSWAVTIKVFQSITIGFCFACILSELVLK